MCRAACGLAAVEVAHLARAHMRGADREARRAPCDEGKIDKLAQSLLQRRRGVEPGIVAPERIVRAEKRERIGLEESRNAAEHGRPIRRCVAEARPIRQAPELLAPHAPPELLEPLNAIVGLVAGNQAGIDGADRGADDPIRPDSRFVLSLIDTRLVRAERAAALKDENNLPLSRCRLRVGLFFTALARG
jgi:hypothetical protein